MISERTDPAAIARAIAGLLRAQDAVAGALAAVRALELPPAPGASAPAPDPGDDAAELTIAVLPEPAAAAPTVPCPTVEIYRAHQSYHRQRPDGTWTCAACTALAPAPALTTSRP